ncbi:FAD-binding oxidoreductase [Caulobacter sp. B11]|uniref:FAD-binding oxidoreductase n=1 Tax=Caulobacter sp. B11 TaxID=2048899 RepID=UPI000C12AF6F|nr:FAD-binding oxidoreductase [Caulobacter sp. B11]PHY12556.1 FAD-binding oxidoreductase [Caulobacter sp. B11]
MEALIAALGAVVGSDAILTGSAIQERYQSPWTRLGAPLAVLRPASTQAVADILRLASAAGVCVVPWGGRTGLVDGCLADDALALSLDRMAAVEAIDSAAGTITVQAGCVLQTASEAAAAHGLLLPLDLGARGSATIGGTIATNAGGNRVLRYGMMRDMVLGLEAVLADGTVIEAMSPLIKNNAGYDLKQLFIGSEGTLGIVTRAVLRLRPAPVSQDTAIVGVEHFSMLPRLLRRLERDLGGALSAFEVMWASFHDLVTTPPARGRPPLAGRYPFYVLIESLGGDVAGDATRFEAALAAALSDGEVADAAIARSTSQREAMWALRDDVAQTAREGPIIAFDISLPISAMEPYVAAVQVDLAARWPSLGAPAVFGHLGDGNLHLIVRLADTTPAVRRAVEDVVYGPLQALCGSISAEHGVGLQKRDFLHLSRGPAEIALMRRLKLALDPRGVLNPGKVLPPAPTLLGEQP